MEFKSSVNGVTEEIADHGMLTLLQCGALQIGSQTHLVKANFIDINEESGCDKKDDYDPEEVTPGKYFILKNS